jgi:hypothetical protein
MDQVIFYQLLFGCRPFGEGQTQEKLLQVSLPLFHAWPAYSEEGQRI